MPDHWEAVAGVPYGWRALATEAGLYRIGDQAAVIASIAGDGIAIALASGAAAANACLAGESAESFQIGFARRAARTRGCQRANIGLPDHAWRAVSRDGHTAVLRRACAAICGRGSTIPPLGSSRARNSSSG